MKQKLKEIVTETAAVTDDVESINMTSPQLKKQLDTDRSSLDGLKKSLKQKQDECATMKTEIEFIVQVSRIVAPLFPHTLSHSHPLAHSLVHSLHSTSNQPC